MSFLLYRIITIIFSPFIDLYMFIRLLRGKEDKKRFAERFGYNKIKRPKGDIIWFQCASVGESNSAMPLIDKIIDKYGKDITILITTGTIASGNIIKKKIEGKKNIIHQYTPIDKYFVIKRFLKYWRPMALITVESEIWPNMINMAHKMCNKVMIANAKISMKSFKRWKKFKKFKEIIFDSIDICYPQSESDQHRLINLGIQNTIYLGNLKFDIPQLKINNEYLTKLTSDIGNRKMFLCASSHDKEEETIIKLYNMLKSNFPNILCIIAIRHPERSKDVFNKLTSYKLNVKRKNLNEIIDDNTNIYLYDEMGEMGTLFELSNIVVMCGSLVEGIGGHNPVEAAKHKCAILTGPYIKNNKELFLELEKNDACIICKNNKHDLLQNLYNNIFTLMNDEELQNTYKENAYNVCEKFSDVANNVAKSIILNLN